jgi:hypothetical protein
MVCAAMKTFKSIDVFGKCSHCKHKNSLGAKCKAYPGRIPKAILTGDHDHTKPYKGDNGIQFEPKE